MSILQDVMKMLPKTPDDLLTCIVDKGRLNLPFLSMLQQCVEMAYQQEYDTALHRTKILLDYVWEKLNTGHWKDVDINWRYCYTVISLMKCVCQASELEGSEDGARKSKYAEIIQTCDMGLLMGAPILENVLSKISSLVQRRHSMQYVNVGGIPQGEKRPRLDDNDAAGVKCLKSDCISQSLDKGREISRIHCPSLQKFRSEHMEKHEPIIITGLMDYWPALSSRPWSVQRIREVAGLRTVPIEIGSKYTEDSWTQSLMTVDEFIDKYIIQAGDIGYLAQHQLLDQVPELRDDIIIPDYCYLGTEDHVDINAWFGPKGTVSPLHYDPKHNLLAQVMGEKYIRLYSDKVSDMIYPHRDMLLCNTSKVDVENPDFTKFPKFRSAKYTECVLKSGEMLYIPPKYWHFVKSLSISFSVSFWFM